MNLLKASPLLLFFFLTGCSWTGNISSDFYTPEVTQQKINATIGLANKYPPSRVSYGMSVDYSLGINEYRDVLKKELAARFKEVIDVKKSEKCDKCLLIAEPRIKLIIDQTSNRYWGRLTVDFVEQNGELYTSIVAQTSGSAAPTASLINQSIATSATMGLLALNTIDNYGDFLIAIGEQAVGELVSEAGRVIASSDELSSKSLAYLDPANQEIIAKEKEIARKKLEKALHTASVCTNNAIKVLDDDVSPVELIAIEAGKLCRAELIAFADTICAKDNLSAQDCRKIHNYIVSRQYSADTITSQVLSNRNLKKRKAGPSTIIIPLTIPEVLPIPVPEKNLKKIPNKQKTPTQILL